MAKHLPGYLVGGWCQAAAMPIRIRPISGRVCGLELTDNSDHLPIADTTTLQAAGRDYTQGWSTFYTSNDNGEICLAVVFLREKKMFFVIGPLPAPIFPFCGSVCTPLASALSH